MNKDLKRISLIAGALLIVAVVASMFYGNVKETERAASVSNAASENPSIFIRPHSRSIGPENAPVTIVEFFDPECESCRAIHPVVQKILSEYDGKLRYVLRYMPLHGNAVYAASVLEAAGEQGHYWEMLEIMLRNQPQWGSHHHPRPELLPGYAKEIGLDVAAIDDVVKSRKYADQIEMDKQDGIKLGVRQTPTFFVNEKQVARLGYGPLKESIDRELGKVGG